MANIITNQTHPIVLNFISRDELEKMVVCEDNKKIINDYVEIISTIEPLSDRPPLPVSVIKSKKKKNILS